MFQMTNCHSDSVRCSSVNEMLTMVESRPIDRVKSTRSFTSQTSREDIESARPRITIRLLPAAFVGHAMKSSRLPCIEPIVSCDPTAKQRRVSSPSCRCDGWCMWNIKTRHCVSPTRGVARGQCVGSLCGC